MRILAAALLSSLLSVSARAAPEAREVAVVLGPDSALSALVLFQQHCAACHERPEGRTPGRREIGAMPGERIFAALTTGVMKDQAAGLSDAQRQLLAAALPQRPPLPSPDVASNRCAASNSLHSQAGDWNGWGADVANSRFAAAPGLRAADVPRLRLKWAFAYPGGGVAGSPVVVSGTLYTISPSGTVFALDAGTGCTRWTAQLGGNVRGTAIAVGRVAGSDVAFAVDGIGTVAAFEAATGREMWRTAVVEGALERTSGAPTLYGGRLYVPFGGGEEVAAMDPAYSCCRTRGGVVALNIADGSIAWKSHTIATPPRPTRVSAARTQLYGPAGASVWSAPTIDPGRRLLYVGTGDDFAEPASDASDAVIAFDLDSGRRVWVSQVTANDIWLAGCGESPHANCPTRLGPDHDFGMPPILARLTNGRSLLLAGNKDGAVYAFDPDREGKVRWRTRLLKGNSLGGLVFGGAFDGRALYMPIGEGDVNGGLAALDAVSGRVLWRAPPIVVPCAWGPDFCTPAQRSAVTAIDGAVFSAAGDGHVRAYASQDGRVIWDFDTAREFTAVNGVTARGGSIGRSGQTVAGGVLYVNAGGGYGQSGNALLAFTVDGR